MSSILKALNRLKDESPKQDETPSWPQEMDMKRAVRGDRKRNWFFNKLVYSLAAVVIVVGAGWLLYNEKPHWVKKIVPWAVSSKQHKDKEEGKGLSTKGKSDKKGVWAGKKGTPRPSMSPTRTLARKAPKKPRPPPTPSGRASRIKPASVPRKQGPTAKSEGRRDTRVPGPFVSQKKRQSGKYALKPTSKAGAKGRDTVSVEPAHDSKFTLQAISWSDDSKKRIAVINDQVVREGSSIEGAKVTRIGGDEVIVREGGKDYKLVFGLR
ncbi:MAG: general secretion pathway protein GspB [Deltaproteobacteria bacterium]|nr:general secretion pathway protein GspB [Deltaproteobacteria bacterium]